MILHYITTAIRNLLKYKGQTLISLLGLSVGLFCFSLCTYLVRYWMSEDDGFRNKNHIANIVLLSERGRIHSGTPAYLGSDIKNKQLTGIEQITVAAYNQKEDLSVEVAPGKELPFELYVVETDTSFLTVFGLKLVQGDLSFINKQPNMLLITQSTARRMFAEQPLIGAKVIGKNGKAYTLGGVIEDLPRNNSISPEPIEALTLSVLEGELSVREQHTTGTFIYALLTPEYPVTELDKQFVSSVYNIMLFESDPSQVRAFSLGTIKHREASYVMLYGFVFFIGLLILLSALLNYFSFFTGTFFNRIKEFSIRKEAGGSKGHLFCLLASEIGLSLLMAGIMALCMAELFIPGYQFSFFRMQIDFDASVLCRHIIQYLLCCMGIATVICWLVSSRIYRKSLQDNLRFSRHRMRNFLLGVQFFISILFLTGAVAAVLQFKEGSKQLFNTLPDEEKERTHFVRTDYPCMDQWRDIFIAKVKTNSITEDVLQIQDRLTSYRVSSYGEKSYGLLLTTSANIASFIHLQPELGSLNLEPNTVLVNSDYVSYEKENPLGKTITFRPDTVSYKIQGAFRSFPRHVDVGQEMKLLVISPLKQGGNCYVKIRQGKEEEGRLFLEQTLKEFLPESIQPEIYTLKAECLRGQSVERMLSSILSFFAIVCLIITLLGTYSAISLDTERRQKEIAVRKINGASFSRILLLFYKLYIKLLTIASLFALPLVWLGVDAMLGSWNVHFDYNNPLFWMGILIVIAIITGTTILFRILKTIRLNPANIIKSE